MTELSPDRYINKESFRLIKQFKHLDLLRTEGQLGDDCGPCNDASRNFDCGNCDKLKGLECVPPLQPSGSDDTPKCQLSHRYQPAPPPVPPPSIPSTTST